MIMGIDTTYGPQKRTGNYKIINTAYNCHFQSSTYSSAASFRSICRAILQIASLQNYLADKAAPLGTDNA
jgi:hypothetical protein